MRSWLAAFCFLVLSSASAVADGFVPFGLAPGSTYQLVFVTADTRDATSANIDDYNAFVAAEAALNPLLPTTTWHAIASTDATPANVNALGILGVPIYDTQGGLFLADAGTLYSATLPGGPVFDQYGNLLTVSGDTRFVWAGSTNAGEKFTTPPPFNEDNALGTTVPNFGMPPDVFFAQIGDPISSDWLGANRIDNLTALHPLYALSAPITVSVPEPATISLIVSALAALGCFGWASRGRRVRR